MATFPTASAASLPAGTPGQAAYKLHFPRQDFSGVSASCSSSRHYQWPPYRSATEPSPPPHPGIIRPCCNNGCAKRLYILRRSAFHSERETSQALISIPIREKQSVVQPPAVLPPRHKTLPSLLNKRQIFNSLQPGQLTEPTDCFS